MFRKFFDIDAFSRSDFSNLKKNNFERIEFSTTYYNMYSFFYLFLLFICIKIELMIFQKWKSKRLNLTRKLLFENIITVIISFFSMQNTINFIKLYKFYEIQDF